MNPKEQAQAELCGIIGETFPPKRNPDEIEAELQSLIPTKTMEEEK